MTWLDADAVLLLSFGGPEGPEEVLPFLRSVTAGRGIPDERLAVVGRHYGEFGGRSPLNDQNRRLQAALRAELDRREIASPVLWSNRHAAPYTIDVLRQAHEDGIRRILVVLTSAYSSYASCRAYREHLASVAAELSEECGATFEFAKIGQYAGRPAFAAANARNVIAAMDPLAGLADSELRLLYVTHSIPVEMDELSGPGDGLGQLYLREHLNVANAVTEQVNSALGRDLEGELVFCSQSGRPGQAWLQPDINARIVELAEAVGSGPRSTLVVVPIGFISDHMEVVYDLDRQAADTAAEHGLPFVRAATVGTDPRFVSDLVDALKSGFGPGDCPAGCCPNVEEYRSAVCGAD